VLLCWWTLPPRDLSLARALAVARVVGRVERAWWRSGKDGRRAAWGGLGGDGPGCLWSGLGACDRRVCAKPVTHRRQNAEKVHRVEPAEPRWRGFS
jgi:hypothetical protein